MTRAEELLRAMEALAEATGRSVNVGSVGVFTETAEPYTVYGHQATRPAVLKELGTWGLKPRRRTKA